MNYDSKANTLELSQEEALTLIAKLALAVQDTNQIMSYGYFSMPCIDDSKFASSFKFLVKDQGELQ